MKYGSGVAPETIWRVDYSLVLFDRKGGALKREKTLFKARRAHKRKPKERKPPPMVTSRPYRAHMFNIPYKPRVPVYCTVPTLDFISRYTGVKEQRRDGKQLASTLSFHLGCDIVPCVGGLASWVTAHESEEEYQARIVRPEAGI